ncbi:MAG: hypothetical protein FGM46_07315, partial [Ferruginibacter sp.]|nr:hypothetical protein [Ferruginibacter sp.]
MGSMNDIFVKNEIIPAIPNLGADTSLCPGQSVLLNPGSFDKYKWQDNSTGSVFRATTTGMYTV